MAEYRAEDYGRAFSRLCHLAALTRSGKLEAALDNLVLTTLVLEPDTGNQPLAALQSAIAAYFGLSPGEDDLRASIHRLAAAGRISDDNVSIVVAPEEVDRVRTRARDASQLELAVRDEWIAQLRESGRPPANLTDKQLWRVLKEFIARAFRRHGVQTLELLDPDLNAMSASDGRLSDMLRESVSAAGVGAVDQAAIQGAIDAFFNTHTPERTRYLAELLDGTFTFFALTIDEVTANYLRGSLQPLSLFLDTNFIFAVIGLHMDYFAELSKEVLELIRQQNLPFTLYYHERTLREIENTVFAIGQRLRHNRWSQSLSRAAYRFGTETGAMSGIELGYHRLNAQQPIDVDVFLTSYEHIEALLSGQGFKIYREDGRPSTSVREKGELVANYESFVKEVRPNRPKPYEALDHDIVVWMTIERLRRSRRSILDSGALFLTNDYVLHRFAWREMRPKGEIGSTILPRQLLQVLRPFVPTTDDFDRRFVETFGIPEFRVMQGDYAQVASKVLSFLATYSELPVETALAVLRETVLGDRLKGVLDDSQGFAQAVESIIADQNRDLIEEREALSQEVAALRESVTATRAAAEKAARAQEAATLELAADASKKEEIRERLESNLRRSEQELRRQETSAGVDRKRIENLETQLSEVRDRNALIGAIVLALLGVLVLWAAPSFGLAPWLAGHSHRWGIELAGSVGWAGVAWLVFIRRHFGVVLIGVVVAAVLVIAQVL